MSKLKNFIMIEIETQFATKFQKETGLKALRLMLDAWAMFYKNSHKKNRISFDIDILGDED